MWLSNKYLTYTKLLILCLKIYSTSAACLSTEYPDPLDPNPNDNTYELCLPCPPGFACDGTSTITECTDGQYWDINACYNCPAGFYCPDKSTSKQYNCPIGTFSTGSATECTLCGANKFCSDPTQEQNCPTGNYASAGSTFCTPCPAGYDCTDPGNLAQCNVGSWSLLGQSTCSLCAAGSYCPSLTTGNQITCPENYYSDTVSNTCLACPAGTECTNNCNSLSDCQNCQVGEFSYAGGYCSACPEGYVCQGNPPQPPTFCNLGQISTDGNTCKDCDHGYFCPEMASEMTPCSKGYQSSPNNNQGAFECELCPDGLDCEDSTSNTTPVSCSNSANYLGKICVGGLVINCPRGTYRSNFLEPASSIENCSSCDPGKCCDSPGTDDFSVPMKPCPPGYYCPTGTANCYQNKCPPGTFDNNNGGLTSAGDCTTCSDGKYCPGGGTTEEDCPPGYFCKAGQISPFENPCPGGTFSTSINLSDGSQCSQCRAGYYCPAGSTHEIECPAGTYNEQTNMPDLLNCLPCQKGFACDNVPISNFATQANNCKPGYYCPRGSKSPDEFPCPAGTYSNSNSLTAASECTPCLQGFYCNFGFTEAIMRTFPCREGYYCPTGSVTETPCPAGTYNDQTEMFQPTDCQTCQAGYFCDIASPTTDFSTQICPNGYTCPAGTERNHQYPCPAGTYNILTGKSDQNTECLLCPKGHYCPAATGHVDYWGVPGIPCPLGTYMDVEGGGTTEGDCKPCVAGYICNLATGTIDPVNDPDAACPSGYYSAAGASECSICEAGRYCPNSATSETDMNNNLCQAGYYCDQGSILDTGIDNFVCIKGYYCPAGTEAMLPCPPGTFNDLEQQVELSNCQKCTAGYWCEEAMDQPPHNEDYYGQRFVCATGHYCPTDISVDSSSQYHTNMGFPSIIGSTGPNEVPCPAGTYRDQTKGAQLSDCFTCTAGFYCLEGSSEQTTCPAGHYCETGNAQNPRPCLAGSFSDQVGLEVATNCTICTLGMYCDTEGLTTPAGLCDPGFICNLGSDTSQPQLTDLNRDGSPMGQPCPAGGYCISGSYQQIACPPKTYNPLTQQMDASNCVFCDAGFYCPPSGTTGLTSNGLPCPAGYYCPQESYYPLPCGAGNYCPDQASVPTKCPVGTYQQSNIAGHCDPCPPGQICQNEGMSNTTPCPTGSYCPQYSTSSTGSEQTTFDSRKSTYIDVTDADGTFGTSDPSGILCVPGTYQPYEEMFDVSACLSCPAGQYCANVGGSQPTNFCLPGYICLGGSITPTPNDNVSGRPCNVGNYCTQDSILDLQCPDGTYREITLGNSLSSCRPCDSGFYCPTPGMSNFTNNVCDDGYYCLADSNSGFGSSTPHQNRCAVGEFCENGNQNTCDSKTYQDLPGQNTCNICPDGKLCPQSDSDCAIDGNCVLDCDAGFYCTAGDKNTCAPGFYNLATGQTSAVDCAACPGGTYCTGSSADDPSNQKTQAGYYSSGGSTSLTPLDLSYCNNICSDVSSCNTACSSQDCNDCGICPEGYYCLEGTNDYKETPCPPGKYGDNSNFQTLSQCKECPAQKACPEEATTSATGSNPYLDCESGYYCTGSCTTTMPDDSVGSCGGICPEMHKCPTGTAVPVLCDDGQEASKNSADCSPCENGYTCTQSGSNIIKAACLPGGYCIAGVRTECPAGTFTSQTGAYNSTFCQECPPGVYCPQGTSDPSSNACAAGYYCPAGSQVPNPNICQVGTCCENGFSRPCPDGKSCNVDGIDCALTNSTTDYDCPAGSFCKDGNAAEPCPAGTYCPTGSVYPSLCSAGTKNLQNEQSLPAACETCSNGTYCWTAINLQADQICDAGYYCDSGSSTSQENKCPAGSFCTNGAQTVCPSGKYQSEETQDSCLTCVSGTYCNTDNLTAPNLCDKGEYCPDGTSVLECQAGTYNFQTRSPSIDVCVNCPFGQACVGTKNTDTTLQDCEAGYYCDRGSDSTQAAECSSGKYCPLATSIEVNCPSGTYSATLGMSDSSECNTCAIGEYCKGDGKAPSDCEAGQFCDAGSKTSNVNCPLGFYCPVGSDKQACTLGYYGERAGLSSATGTSGCTECLKGKICNQNNITMIDLLSDPQYECPAGSYCQKRSDFCTASSSCESSGTGCCQCPSDKICPANSSLPKNCDTLGEYRANSTACSACPAGSYCGSNLNQGTCESGYYCPEGTSSDAKTTNACPMGKYGTKTGAIDETDGCTDCDSGYACLREGQSQSQAIVDNNKCLDGFYCPSGSVTKEGATDKTSPQTNNKCPAGSKCETGSSTPENCQPQTYQELENQSTCSTCPAGYMCDSSNMTLSDLVDCTAGSYCPSGSDSMTACNSGKFSNILNAFSSTQCQKCKAGYYCDSAVTDSTNMLTNECAAGYYCPPSSTSATPANTQCDAGTFCEAASTIELDCPKNYFCENSVDQKGLTTTVNSTHECQAGCYCEGAAATSCPSSCPTGSFCETGTSPVFCPAGTYSTSTGLSNSSSCTNCDAGYICRTSGQSTSLVDSQKCPDSYFCPTQTATLNDSNLCDAGYNCSNGATNAQNSACNNGFFQAAQGQFTCDQCQAGYYCPENSGLGNSDMTDVNKGSKSSNQASVETPCPAGTYNLLDNSVDCQPCPPGKFCDTTGIFDVSTQNCTEGYYCQDGSSSSTPSVNSNDPSINDPFYWGNGPCPKGHYCEDGTVTPTPCPIQTYNPNRYGRDSNACIPCSAGSICELTGQSSEGNGCLPGFDCTSGSQVPCEAGFYCPGGNQAPIACGAGTYNDKTQSTDLTACLPCPAGFYCNASNMTAGLECTVGNYCPEGSITETACPSDSIVACNEPGLQCPYFCPDGLYSSDGLNCISCPSGKICRSDDITVDCSNFNPTLVAVVNCPAGRYCDATDLSAQIVGNPCPAGKYVANQGSNDVTQCVNCDAGYYCDQAASTTSTENVCMDGYICNSGSTFGQSEFCPPGSFCKNGFKNPCPVGTWNPDFNQVACLNCPSGFFCNTQEITEITLSLACSPGNYCLEGTTTEDACPPGTIRRTTGAGAVDECYPCPAGFYCESGSSTPTGICDEGFYCPSGSQSATERTCEIGNYCTCEDANGRIGCSRPIPCQQGYACPSGGMKKSDMLAQTCDPGFYCVLGSSSTSPPADSGNYGPCPAGFYCPGGLPTLVPCPIGTFSSATGQTSDGTCVDCTEGSYCDSPGLTAITGTCEDGYYCPPASSNSKFQLCPAGFKCLNGLTVDCDAGTYQPNSGKNTECLTCEPGYICEITPNTPTLLPSDLCPAGYYCPGDDPNNIQRNCLPGTYNDQTGQVSSEACKACPAGVACTTEALTAIPTNSNCESGFYCLGGSTTNYPQDASFDPLAAITNGPCPAGYYCEEQTSFPTPCPDGTYSTDQQLSQISGCLDCNQGFYCPERAQDTIPSLVCPVGYYCPSKSSEPTICPVGSYCVGGLPIHNTCDPGTYQPQEGQDFCLDCPPGYYCPSGTSDISTLTCPEKYYCPAQTKTAQQYSCPTGFQCPAGSPEPQSCEVGTYTQTSAQASCVTCDAGYYCPLKSDLSTTEKITCPVGSYCPASSKIPTPCPVGTYGIRTRAETETDGCSICQSGSYCDIEGLVAADLNSRLISEGYYCSQGCKNSKPGDTCNSDPDCDGGICSAGFKCAEGSGSMSDCASGRYQDKQGQTTCPDCPGGFYCRIGTNITLGSLPVECPKGYYCPNNTANYESNMCPSGTFLETTKATDESECTVCTAGSSCAGSALTGPADLGDCVEGYYCPTGQVLPAPSNYRCEVGNYCPGKSANQTECIAGFACINPGTSTPSIPCKEGFYCPAGSTQVDQVPCPAGFYCQQQSAFPLPCPVGTYSTLTERTEPSDCINCDIGFYCDEVGKNTTSGKCAPGYYCPSPGGLTTPKHTICPTGSYCLEGSSQPTNCDFGEYQPDEGQDSCLPCPAGFMCGTNTTTPVNCPQGFYCLEGTKDGEQEACPDGTFSDLTNLASSTQCQTCPIGNYCKGGTNLGVCSPGYYCEEGSNTNQQFSCTRGHYCTDGIQYPCPAGTYSTSSGAQSANDCAACPAGSYCIDASKSDCSEGFQCLGDANAPEPIDGITGKACDPGFYCPDGETSDVCDNQNWQPKPGQSNCQSCLEGYYCPDSSTTGLSNIENSFCPAGYYCKANSFVYTTNAIPKGFYSDLTHQSTENYKAQCPPGFACTTAAISNPFDVNNYCEAGYYCEEGATNKQDILCPSGYYCEEGTEAPVMCPAGSFRQLTGARSVSDCSNCLGGDYCIGGESNISGDCLATTYCPLSDTNRNTEDSGVDCTPGHCCLAGSEAPTPCDINTYVEHESLECLNGNVGQCLPCPAGFQCATTATINPTPCPAGSYCPEGEIHLCPDGTYSTQTGLSAVEECLPCDRGSYCNNGQKQGICDAGYYCSSGAASATPNPLVEANFEIQGSNGLCPVGYYCTAGTLFPEACGNNQVITVAGATSAADCEDCPDGYDCPSTVPIICPTGFYCAGGVTTACPEGTVNSRTGQILITDCTTCSAGYNCDKTGISDQGDFKCEAGYYCEAGTNGIDKLPIPCPLGTYNPTLLAGAASDCKICPAGTFCLENSVQPEPCFAYVSNSTGSLVSSYCPEQYIVDAGETQNTQICQEGFYCPEPAVEIVCPKKFYCPAGTQSPIPCPIGFYCPVTEDANGNLIVGSITPVVCDLGYRTLNPAGQTTEADTCEQCPAGTYGNDARTTCTPCKAGVICDAGAITDFPEALNTLNRTYPCPRGYYCPTGSVNPTPCDPGSYNRWTYGTSSDSCLSCPIDYYNDKKASISCDYCGDDASTSAIGGTTCVCNIIGAIFQPSDNTCVCQPGYQQNGNTCELIVYTRCFDNQYRTQKGECFTQAQFENYCETEYCETGAYRGVEPSTGICLCETVDLETICDVQCRENQKATLTLECPGLLAQSQNQSPFLQLTDGAGTTLSTYSIFDLTTITNSLSTFTDSCTAQQSATDTGSSITFDATSFGTSQPVFIMDANTQSFAGVYQPDPTILQEFFDLVSTNTTLRRKKRAITNGFRTNAEATSVNNPVICVQLNTLFMMSLQENTYPNYDPDNLFNDNDNFDYGAFKALAQQNSGVFVYLFEASGAYAFKLDSTDNSVTSDKYFYVRVMDQSSICPEEGPFLPPTERSFTTTGLSVRSNILQEPDWPVIIFVLVGSIIIVLGSTIFLLIVKNYAWKEPNIPTEPDYRKRALAYDFRKYASKNASINYQKVIHPLGVFNNRREHQKLLAGHTTTVNTEATSAKNIRHDDFWDTHQQKEVEAMQSKSVYQIMENQAEKINLKLSKRNEDHNKVYQTLEENTMDLKDQLAEKIDAENDHVVLDEVTIQKIKQDKQNSEKLVFQRREMANTALEFYKNLIEKRTGELNFVKNQYSHQQMIVYEMMENIKDYLSKDPSLFKKKDIKDWKVSRIDRISSRIDLYLENFNALMSKLKPNFDKDILFLDTSIQKSSKIVNLVSSRHSVRIFGCDKSKNVNKNLETRNLRFNENILDTNSKLTTKLLSAKFVSDQEIIGNGAVITSVFTNLLAPVEYGAISKSGEDGNLNVILGLDRNNRPIFSENLEVENFPNMLIDLSITQNISNLQKKILNEMNQILMFLVKETMKDDDYASVMTSAEISNKKEMQELNKLLAKFKHLANEAIAIKINEIIELTRRQKTMEILSVTGTQLGVYKDVLSNLKLPCLPGKKIIDPNEYTTQMTQVLGAYIHEDEEYTSLSTRTFIRPISGTIKLENGNFQEINSGIFVNEDLGHIVTGKLDLDSQNSGADQKIVPVYNKNDLVGRRHKYTGNVIRSLQSEISQRRQFFNSQNKKEEAIISEVLKFLSEYILYLKNIDVKDISESDLEIDKKLIEIALPISELATSVTRIFNSEKERRDISLTDISNYINENIVMETSLVNPILELTYFDKIEVEAMKKLSHELDKLAELSDFAGRRLNNEVDKLRERFDQLNSIDAAVNPDIQPAKLAAETRFSNAVKILITEVNESVNNRVSYVIKAIYNNKNIRNMILETGEIALNSLNPDHFVAYELEWQNIITPLKMVDDKPLFPLIRNILKALKEKDKLLLAPDSLAIREANNIVLKVDKEKENLAAETNLEHLQTDVDSDINKFLESQQVFGNQHESHASQKAETKKPDEKMNNLQFENKLNNDAAKYLKDLKDKEANELMNLVNSYTADKYDTLEKMKKELQEKLKSASTPEEKQKLLEEYAVKMLDLAAEIDERKNKDANQLIDNLLDNHKNKKLAFYEDQKNQVLNSNSSDKDALIQTLDRKIADLEEPETRKTLRTELEKLKDQQNAIAESLYEKDSGETLEEMKARFARELAEKMKFLQAAKLVDENSNLESNLMGEVEEYVKERKLVSKKLRGRRRVRKDTGGSEESGEEEVELDDTEKMVYNLVLSALDDNQTLTENSKLKASMVNHENADELLQNFENYLNQMNHLSDDRKKLLKEKLLNRIQNRQKLLSNKHADYNLDRELGHDLIHPGDLETDIKSIFEKLDASDQNENLEFKKLADIEDQKIMTKIADSFNPDLDNAGKDKLAMACMDLSSQVASLLNSNSEEAENLRHKLAAEKAANREKLAEKLRKMKNNKLKKLSQQGEIANDQMVKAENKASVNRMNQENEAKLQSFMTRKDHLLKKHAIELAKLNDNHAHENGIEIKKNTEKLTGKRQNLRDNLDHDFEDEIQALHNKFNQQLKAELDSVENNFKKLLKPGQKLSKSKLEKMNQQKALIVNDVKDQEGKQLANLSKDHQDKLNKFDADTEKLLKKSVNKINPRILLEQANEKLALQEKQLKEMTNLIKFTTTKNDLENSNQEELDRLAEDFRVKRLEIINAANQKLLDQKKKKQSGSDETRRKLEAEIRERQKEYDEMIEAEKQKEVEKINYEIKRKLEANDDTLKMDLDIISERNDLDQQTKDQLIKQALEDQQRLQNKLKRERSNMQSSLLARLNLKKQKKKQLIQDQLTQEAEIQNLETEDLNKSSASLNIGEEVVKNFGNLQVIPEEGDNQTGKPAKIKPKYNIPDWSKIEQDMNGILNHSLATDSKDSGSKTTASQSLEITQILLDPTDKQFVLEGNLSPVARQNLSNSEIFNWRYSQFIADYVVSKLKLIKTNQTSHLTLKIDIKISKTLPDNNYANNAFRRSFYYDFKSHTLWIRKQRLVKISELLVIICHCVSHILINTDVNDLPNGPKFNDHDDQFISNLYVALKNMSQVSQPIFEKQVGPVSLSKTGDSTVDSVLENMIDQKLERVFR